MPDDAPPPEGTAPAPIPELKLSAKDIKAQRVEIARRRLVGGDAPSQVIDWLSRVEEGKPWKLTRRTARDYVDLAMAQLSAEVVQPKDRKQARVRAMLTLAFQRAMTLAHRDGLEHKAAGLLTAAIAAVDKIAKVDGAYAFDGSTLVPTVVNVATPEEAARLVAHAQATIELATRRGALQPAGPPSPTVIDATAEEADADEDMPDQPLDAN